MSNGRILIVEDDPDTADVLRLYFTGAGYVVDVAHRGERALVLTRTRTPDLIVLDINLPGMDGYEVCRRLRTSARTGHVPIIFLTQRDERRDRLAGLELGADDYVTKPFDIQELGLRAKNAIRSHRRMNMSDPRTGLPAARLIEEQLRQLVRREGWTYAEITLEHIDAFAATYGFVAADEVLRYVGLLLSNVIEEFGTEGDFLGQASESTFVIITHANQAERIMSEIQSQFGDGILTHYNFLDTEQGGVYQANGALAPLMRLRVGTVDDRDGPFTDIRQITEVAAAGRRTVWS